MIRRLTIVLAISAFALSAQTKKILVMGAGPDVKEYQSASPKANVIPVTKETVMKEIVDADAFIGTITPAEAASGAEIRLVLSPTPPVECLSTLMPGMELRSTVSPERTMHSVSALTSRSDIPEKKTAIRKADI